MTIKIIRADYTNPYHGKAIIDLLNEYAQGDSGGGRPLSDFTQKHLIEKLAQLAQAYTLLAYHEDSAIGLVNCLVGFSTFQCEALTNIHDIIVSENYRQQGIAQQLLQEVENIAKANKHCKITLEVLEGNSGAKRAYQKFGFCGYELDPAMGQALFWEKKL